MTNSQRIIVNTSAQYLRTIINVCLSLYSTRLILSALGQSDFGIYSVVAGVVAMLAFLTNALVTTTQRYLSYYHGAGDTKKVYSVFANSLWLHVAIGLGLTIILCSIAKWVTHSYLNIADSRDQAAMMVYLASVGMLLLSFLTAPFRALFIARENIVYISIIDVLDGVLKLGVAIWLGHMVCDRLEMYGLMMAGIQGVNLFAFGIYALIRFPECHLPSLHELDKNYLKELSGFTGWTIYSTGCIIVRTQGIGVLLNRFFGTITNAAYGIALQVVGAVHFIAQSILNAMNPQIMKAEGAHQRTQMLDLAEKASKYAFLLLSLVVVPLVIEMEAVLRLWLGDVPAGSVMFCQFVLATSLCDQLTIGLGSANQAIGKIRNYSIVVNTIKVLTLPAACVCLKCGLPMQSVMWCYVAFELICSFVRLPFLKITAGLSIINFIKNVIWRSIFPIVVSIVVCYLITQFINMPFRFLLTISVSVLVEIVLIFFCSLTNEEKHIILASIKNKHN